MKTEFECRFLDTDIDAMRGRLKVAGYDCVKPEFLMKRMVFDLPGTDDYEQWIRLRDEGDGITVTRKIKAKGDKHIASLKETTVDVGNFDDMREFLVGVGFSHEPLQENRREMWTKGDVEVCVDTWPGLNTYTEVESVSEEAVKKAAEELGFVWNNARFGNVSEVYREVLGLERHEFQQCCTFDNPPKKK